MVHCHTGATDMRYTAFNNLGTVWWNWAKDNAPSGTRPSRRSIAMALGVSYQTIADIVNKRCTLDRVYDYMPKLMDKGWPKTRIVVDGTEVTLEVIGSIEAAA